MGPEVFDRIEFRGIRWYGDEFQPRVVSQNSPDVGTAVAGPAIPDDDDPTAEMTQKLPEKRGDAGPVERSVGNRAKVEAESTTPGRQAEGGNDGHLLSVSTTDQKLWCLALRGQSAANQRAQEQATFVEESNGGSLAARPF